jgi:adenylate cyclase class 1
MLDNRAYWKSPHVIAERALLVNELNHSYRLLSDLNKQQGFNAAISNEELMILGRKLHAAFERKAGKIEWINPGISRDLSEPSLCIVEERSSAGEVWQLVRGSQRSKPGAVLCPSLSHAHKNGFHGWDGISALSRC